MANVNPWGHNLREELRAMLQRSENDLINVSQTLREVFEEGREQASGTREA